jgi:hypothetical protein
VVLCVVVPLVVLVCFCLVVALASLTLLAAPTPTTMQELLEATVASGEGGTAGAAGAKLGQAGSSSCGEGQGHDEDECQNGTCTVLSRHLQQELQQQQMLIGAGWCQHTVDSWDAADDRAVACDRTCHSVLNL